MLPSSCTSRKLDPTLCFFPQNLQQYIKTPLFIINSAYDSYQKSVISFRNRLRRKYNHLNRNKWKRISVSSRWHQWLFLVICSLIQVKAEVLQPTVEKTLVKDAVSKGAVCLDGSPAAYHYDKGFGDGVNNWVVFLEGGGWCGSVEDCGLRFGNSTGSSNHMDNTRVFSGLLDYNKTNNPDFYNWHRIMIKYCDGSSFTGDVESVDKATNQHYRGARIFQTIMEELLAKGMKNAKNAILSGNSAGGLASMIHCDRFRSLLPSTPRVKCLSDGGYFLLDNGGKRGKVLESTFAAVVNLHNSAKMLPSSCTSRKLDPTLCFFPQNLQQYIKTPLFIINSAYDSYQFLSFSNDGKRGKVLESTFAAVVNLHVLFLNLSL
ncbi:pectin acetylesterase 7-like [Lycium barbarum]|uniref:pectin acetylesterase 7-like n=1 Tax=Lycium barbarum TaxID=112863 RepID=UPI00293F1177|nr:pectin acetylesterase 7-like [Lycium barbarum]